MERRIQSELPDGSVMSELTAASATVPGAEPGRVPRYSQYAYVSAAYNRSKAMTTRRLYEAMFEIMYIE